MDKENELGELLKRHREKAFPDEGLRRVAEKVGIDYAHLFRLEAGQYVPTDESLQKIANAYKLDAQAQLLMFNLARLSDHHLRIIERAGEDAVVGAFFRKSKRPQK
ncbi:MAG: helix-turn-helix transcriptional regulator [Candidatus Kaiserbacteria bacterium]|nr:helix-turn-helix transcriptional regulator [Candidatus Kaiserbacteria bacterium]